MTGRRAQGFKWGVAAALAGAALVAGPPLARSAPPAAGHVRVIVQETAGAGSGPEHAVVALGGTPGVKLPVIGGFAAEVPADALDELRATPGVRAVSRDRRMRMGDARPRPVPGPRRAPTRVGGLLDGWDAAGDAGSLQRTVAITGAGRFWSRGYTGRGVDVALVDSGVAPVEGLTRPGKLVYGPDLSFESQQEDLRNVDSYGHGTHMAGIIAGYDSAAPNPPRPADARSFVGMAPGARIVSLKVADRDGAVDVSQVIAAIDWVIQHRNADGLNIRVLNLSFGTDGVQDYRVDPLAYAVEAAWRKGIVVVVAAGNAGFGSAKLNDPAYDPYVLAVGASDPKGTIAPRDDEVPAFSSSGDGTRDPDLVAPGKSIVSLRAPGGGIDTMHPEGRVGTSRFFRGTGTSQAAAVVSGAAALLLQQRPGLRPDQVKAILRSSSLPLPRSASRSQGAGALNLRRAYGMRTPARRSTAQAWPVSDGSGSLDAARGTQRLDDEGAVLDGERDIFGNPWDGRSWAAALWNGTSWSGGDWNGATWTGSAWSDTAWSGSGWDGRTWSGRTWSGRTWSGRTWSGRTWSGRTWSGRTWSGRTWSGRTWSGRTWSGRTWSGRTWSGRTWSADGWAGRTWSAAGWGPAAR